MENTSSWYPGSVWEKFEILPERVDYLKQVTKEMYEATDSKAGFMKEVAEHQQLSTLEKVLLAHRVGEMQMWE